MTEISEQELGYDHHHHDRHHHDHHHHDRHHHDSIQNDAQLIQKILKPVNWIFFHVIIVLLGQKNTEQVPDLHGVPERRQGGWLWVVS